MIMNQPALKFSSITFQHFLPVPEFILKTFTSFRICAVKGIGKALLVHLARIAKERNCGRFEWAVLDWNEPSIAFYKKLGAIPLDDWTTFRMTGKALDALGKQPAPKPE